MLAFKASELHFPMRTFSTALSQHEVVLQDRLRELETLSDECMVRANAYRPDLPHDAATMEMRKLCALGRQLGKNDRELEKCRVIIEMNMLHMATL